MNVLKADKDLKDAAAAFGRLTAGHIRLGGLQLAMARFPPDLVRRMQTAHPGILLGLQPNTYCTSIVRQFTFQKLKVQNKKAPCKT